MGGEGESLTGTIPPRHVGDRGGVDEINTSTKDLLVREFEI